MLAVEWIWCVKVGEKKRAGSEEWEEREKEWKARVEEKEEELRRERKEKEKEIKEKEAAQRKVQQLQDMIEKTEKGLERRRTELSNLDMTSSLESCSMTYLTHFFSFPPFFSSFHGSFFFSSVTISFPPMSNSSLTLFK